MEERLRAAHRERMSLADGQLLADIDEGVATITLNRPAVLNALSFAMLEGLAECLDAWEHDDALEAIVLRGSGDRAFCAGGDIRALYGVLKATGQGDLHYFDVEYALDQRIHEYPKPIAALMDGIVMGGGMGISQGARLRVVGDRTRMAMPETGIGLFPDVGGSYFLSRAPGNLGMYLGLVGPTIGAADALYCGLADVYLPRAAIDGFTMEHALRMGQRRIEGGELERLRPAIDEHFGKQSVEAMVASLEREDRAPFRDWAQRTLAELARRSATMLKVTFDELRRGASMPLGDCFRMERALIERCFTHGDMLEGIRALLVDKDNRPRWNPATLAEVTPALVESFFPERTP